MNRPLRAALLGLAFLVPALTATATADARYKAVMDTSTPTTTVTFVEAGSTPNASDGLVLRSAGPRMMHDRFDKGDTQFASDLDFDTSKSGNQYLPTASSSKIVVNAGGGDDLIRLGAPPVGAGAQNYSGQLVANGGVGYDMLLVDSLGDGKRNLTLTDTSVSGYPGPITRSSVEKLTVMTGSNNDNVVIDKQSKLLNVFTGAGNDRIAFTSNPGFMDLHGGFLSMGAGTDQLDTRACCPSAPIAPQWRYYEARLTTLGIQGANGTPPSPGLGYAALRVDAGDQRTFDLDVLVTDLIGGKITSSTMNSGDRLMPGPVTYSLGTVGWLPTLGAHRALSLANRVDPDTDPALATSISTLSGSPGRHIRVNTSFFPQGEIAGPITDPNTTAGSLPGVKFASSVEQVFSP